MHLGPLNSFAIPSLAERTLINHTSELMIGLNEFISEVCIRGIITGSEGLITAMQTVYDQIDHLGPLNNIAIP
jgi:hypothetical protein